MRNIWAFAWGALVGVLGGLIGLGGAEFRLPVLVGIFNYRTLQAIVVNLIVSLVTVTFSFIFRSGIVGLENVVANGATIVNILAGSLIGSYLGVNYATHFNERVLNRVIAVFLILGAFIGSSLLGYVSSSLLYSILGTILLLSALKLARHQPATSD